MAAVGEAAASAKCCIRIFFRLICSLNSLLLPDDRSGGLTIDHMRSTAKAMHSNMAVVSLVFLVEQR